MSSLLEVGAADWYEQDVEWLVVHLVTEIGTAPQNTASGHSAMSLLATLQGTIVELKKRRYDKWQPRKTVQLVQDYLICMDDLKLLGISFGRKLDLFERLLCDTRSHEEAETSHINKKNRRKTVPTSGMGHSCRQRGQTVCQRDARGPESGPNYGERHSVYTSKQAFTNNPLSSQLNQLRSVEQNELAMITDSQNRALFVFTGVTIVFLPLSFLTSYYGMNVVGIQNTLITESGFWKIAGPAAFGIISFVIFCATLYRRFDSTRTFRAREPERQILSQQETIVKEPV